MLTGIFKKPVEGPIFLEDEQVASDTVADPKHHGGKDKACYLFSADQYPHWKGLYPQLDWEWGMFGENLTVAGMADHLIRIGDIFKVGTATVQVTMPRQPCYKLGHRFKDQGVIAQFVARENPGAYVRILEKGQVAKGDRIHLLEPSSNTLTLVEFFHLCYARVKDPKLINKALKNQALPEYKRIQLEQEQKKGA